ncbi:pyruvate formate lyase family protein [Sphingomonas sp. AOB5]|uniref:pyruvate formate lyase family protein n=1 Tax=Sphingomonas sp. AOB5 TaxID=3034017 RepID=UPI0023F89026|nr:pyruvate formate lyase family protein [Sphingomonas sp. AOB5]MDF7776444.1 pyruvate formate lyase family protein [Sphingomonas sp. AOB5]
MEQALLDTVSDMGTEGSAGLALTPRIQAMLDAFRTNSDPIPVGIAKALITTEAFRETEGRPQVIRCAHAFARVLDEVPIFIAPDDMLAGNLASKPGGVELSCFWATWPEAELDALNSGGFIVEDSDRPAIAAMNDYWRTRSLTSRMTSLYDDNRLWPYAQLGVVLPPFRSKEEGWGPGGMLGVGYGIHHEISQIIGVFRIDQVIERGLDAMIAEARAERDATRLMSADAVEKIDMLDGVIMALEAMVRFAARFAAEADRLADSETDPARRDELRVIAEMCRHVPAKPARTFREAMQSLWFAVLGLLPSGVLSYGRFDDYMLPYYEADIAAGRITDAEVIELLAWLRIKDSGIVITAGQTHRSKYGGFAKWHNLGIGGQNADGSDATSALSYLLLEAAKLCPTPHPTLTMRVHEGTPEPLMREALKLIGTGIGVPSMIGDESSIQFLVKEGVPLETARGYGVAGCLGINIPGQSRTIAWPMFTVPLVLQFAIHGGVDPRSGEQVGPVTTKLAECGSYEAFLDGFKTQLGHFLELQAEFNNVTMRAYAERFPQTVETALSDGLIQSGKNILGHPLPFENGSCLNPIGMINASDSLAALKSVVFERKLATPAEFAAALASNWAGERGAELRALALAAPKYGNDDDAADLIAADLYAFWADRGTALTTTYGGNFKVASISIGTSTIPGGAATGATPDGRMAGEALADESLSPMRGRDTSGIHALLRSALKIDQARYQAMSLDLRFHPEALDGDERLAAVSRLVRDYFAAGGKHMQFNVLDTDALLDAQTNPDAHPGEIVRIGGCSAFFVGLTPAAQHDVLNRTEYREI